MITGRSKAFAHHPVEPVRAYAFLPEGVAQQHGMLLRLGILSRFEIEANQLAVAVEKTHGSQWVLPEARACRYSTLPKPPSTASAAAWPGGL